MEWCVGINNSTFVTPKFLIFFNDNIFFIASIPKSSKIFHSEAFRLIEQEIAAVDGDFEALPNYLGY